LAGKYPLDSGLNPGRRIDENADARRDIGWCKPAFSPLVKSQGGREVPSTRAES
jgi:hypothetical protein